MGTRTTLSRRRAGLGIGAILSAWDCSRGSPPASRAPAARVRMLGPGRVRLRAGIMAVVVAGKAGRVRIVRWLDAGDVGEQVVEAGRHWRIPMRRRDVV